jgi:Domain of unknown function (DUF4389)
VDNADRMAEHPVRMEVTDDLRRSRLTVFFRLLLSIPHFIWIVLWGIAVFVVAIVGWFITLATGRLPRGLHGFMAAYVRYWSHLSAYVLLAANPYPGFVGEAGSYPVDLQLPEPERQNRWKTAFRLVLAFPVLILSSVIAGDAVPSFGAGDWSEGDEPRGAEFLSFLLPVGGLAAGVVSILAWFACLALGRSPQGFRDLVTYGIRYGGQVSSFFLLLTDRYPNSDPATLPAPQPVPGHPVRLTNADRLRRSRLTVFFRVLLFFPHYIWLSLWGIAASVVAIVNWFATLALGRSPEPLHRFLSAYIRYQTHAYAFLMLIGNPFPGFVGAPGSYPIDLEIDPPHRQSRWITGFRLFLVIPALVLAYTLGFFVLSAVAIYSWVVALLFGRAPVGLRNLGAYVVQYWAQTYAYLYLLTDRYPFSGPLWWVEPEPEPPVAVAEVF